MSIGYSRISVPPIGSGEARVHLFRRYLISTRLIPRQILSTHVPTKSGFCLSAHRAQPTVQPVIV